MTMWHPDISRASGPIYLAIADAIAHGIDAGDLAPGERLPTHRELADGLRVALTTVTRGYGEAERRGLVVGEVGRGTFVKGGRPSERAAGTEEPSSIDLTVNALLPYAHADHLALSIAEVVTQSDALSALDYQPQAGSESQRIAGAVLMERSGVAATADRVLVTSGAQHAMAITLGTLANPGDTVLTEELTYSGMKSLAHHLHLHLKGLAIDQDGLRPDAFQAACEAGTAKALYTMPTLHNPVGTVMPEDRRAEIAAIAQRFGVPVVEDDSYGFLLPEVRPLAAQSPDIYYITGTSKSLAPSLRIGFLRAPLDMVDRLTAAISSTTFLASPVMASVAASWVFDGTADRIMVWKRKEIAARQEMAHDILGRFGYRMHPMAQHGWLQLPEPWCTEDFVCHARMRGVMVSPAESFVAGRAAPPYAVRVTLGSVASRTTLERGLTILAEILAQPPAPCQSVV